jgi:methylase of polypeptide subunit release factors
MTPDGDQATTRESLTGLDGLTLHRRILDGAAQRLIPGGRIYLEIAFDQGPAALAITEDHGKDRVLTCRRKGGPS